jgi:predicted GNAT family acetyltransferase
VTVTDNPDRRRFELHEDGHLAELTYRFDGDRMVLVHTGVPAELEGRGLGGQLVRAAVDHAAERGIILVPRCPFARSWLEKHPDEAARAEVEWPG